MKKGVDTKTIIIVVLICLLTIVIIYGIKIGSFSKNANLLSTNPEPTTILNKYLIEENNAPLNINNEYNNYNIDLVVTPRIVCVDSGATIRITSNIIKGICTLFKDTGSGYKNYKDINLNSDGYYSEIVTIDDRGGMTFKASCCDLEKRCKLSNEEELTIERCEITEEPSSTNINTTASSSQNWACCRDAAWVRSCKTTCAVGETTIVSGFGSEALCNVSCLGSTPEEPEEPEEILTQTWACCRSSTNTRSCKTTCAVGETTVTSGFASEAICSASCLTGCQDYSYLEPHETGIQFDIFGCCKSLSTNTEYCDACPNGDWTSILNESFCTGTKCSSQIKDCKDVTEPGLCAFGKCIGAESYCTDSEYGLGYAHGVYKSSLISPNTSGCSFFANNYCISHGSTTRNSVFEKSNYCCFICKNE
ncbi:MAG: hypothetical protein WC413_00260 [Candidatus Nanoarchaeia archaeon]